MRVQDPESGNSSPDWIRHLFLHPIPLALRGLDSAQKLNGIAFEHFAAFLSRAYREHDYLLGRLHSIDRLIDIVCNSAGAEALHGIDVMALKQRGFMQILDREEPHLPSSNALIAELRNSITELSRGRS